MPTYKVKPNGFEELRKRLVPRFLLIFGFLLAAIVYADYPRNDGKNSLISFLFTLVMMVAIMTFVWFRTMKKQKEMFEGTQITIDNQTIVRERPFTPTIRVEGSEIKEIVKDRFGNIAIKTARKLDFILVPAQIENKDQLEELLQAFSLIKPPSGKTFLEKYWYVLPLITLIFMGIMYAVKDKYVALATGICLVAMLIWSIVVAQMSKNVDKGMKRSSYWGIFLILVIIEIIIARFHG